jgi:hypothetical protein
LIQASAASLTVMDLDAGVWVPARPLEPEIRDAQADGVVAHDALDILRETVGGLGIDV